MAYIQSALFITAIAFTLIEAFVFKTLILKFK